MEAKKLTLSYGARAGTASSERPLPPPFQVAESVEGSLDFDFGAAAPFLAAAYEDPATRAAIEATLQTAVAQGRGAR